MALLILVTVGFMTGLAIFMWVRIRSPQIYREIQAVPDSYRVAIVFGAGLRGGEPSPVLRDRISAAVWLYQTHKVEKILMSGDNRFADYNEPAAMQRQAVKDGVPEADIILDFAGRRTYDTCYRAQYIFGLDRAILVTSDYHLPRALYTCAGLGMQVVGFEPNQGDYAQEPLWMLREVPASVVAWWETWRKPESEIMGKPESIFPESEIEEPVSSPPSS